MACMASENDLHPSTFLFK